VLTFWTVVAHLVFALVSLPHFEAPLGIKVTTNDDKVSPTAGWDIHIPFGTDRVIYKIEGSVRRAHSTGIDPSDLFASVARSTQQLGVMW
jgi:hypothetical protein